jgi:hypothetical protein
LLFVVKILFNVNGVLIFVIIGGLCFILSMFLCVIILIWIMLGINITMHISFKSFVTSL